MNFWSVGFNPYFVGDEFVSKTMISREIMIACFNPYFVGDEFVRRKTLS